MSWITEHGTDAVLSLISLLAGAGLSLLIQHLYRAKTVEVMVGHSASRVLRHTDSRLKLLFLSDDAKERIVTDPYLLEVLIVNRGRADLRSDAFEGGVPLQMSVGTAKVIEVSSPATLAPTSLRVERADESTIDVLPAMLKARQNWAFSVVLDGPPDITWRHDHLADVTVLLPDEVMKTPMRRVLLGGILALVLAVVLFVTAVLNPGHASWLIFPTGIVGVISINLLIKYVLTREKVREMRAAAQWLGPIPD